MRDVEEIRADLEAARTKRDRLIDEMNAIAGQGEVTRGQKERFERLERGAQNAQDDFNDLDQEWRDATHDQIRRAALEGRTESGDGARRGSEKSPVDPLRPRLSREDSQVISRARGLLDRSHKSISTESGDQVDRLLTADLTDDFDPSYIARRMLVTETPEYKSAWLRTLQAGQRNMPVVLTSEEAHALRAYEMLERSYNQAFEIYRGFSENGANSAGLGVPSLIDPSIIITSGAADVPLLKYCSIKPVTNNLWQGISSAGMTWSYDTEGAEVSDDAPDLAKPTVTVHMARGFLPYSVEAGMDYPNFAEEMGELLDSGYKDLLAEKLMTGSGTGEPFGVFTALDANTNVEVVTTTDGSFGGEDIFKVWNALKERYRMRSTWIMSVSVQSKIRQFAAVASSTSAYFTIDLTGGEFRINDRPVIVTDYAPTFSGSVPGTTGAANILVVGDWRNYVFAQRAGMTIEPVPHLFHTSNNRPSGQRGLFAWSRNGGDMVNDLGARLLQNQ